MGERGRKILRELNIQLNAKISSNKEDLSVENVQKMQHPTQNNEQSKTSLVLESLGTKHANNILRDGDEPLGNPKERIQQDTSIYKKDVITQEKNLEPHTHDEQSKTSLVLDTENADIMTAKLPNGRIEQGATISENVLLMEEDNVKLSTPNQQSIVSLVAATEHDDTLIVDDALLERMDEEIEQHLPIHENVLGTDAKQLSANSKVSKLEQASPGPPSEFYVEMNNGMPTKLRILRNKTYRISPVHSDGSDLDDSDADPTYDNEVEWSGRKRKFPFLTETTPEPAAPDQLSSESDSSEEEIKNKKSRKRIRDPTRWKQNKAKFLRNTGQAYVSMSNSRREFAARKLKPPCTEKCRLKCSRKIKNTKRVEILNALWKLSDNCKQRFFIHSCMKEVSPKYKYTNAERPRKSNKAFYLMVDNLQIRACKIFFKNTLNVTDRMIRTVVDKMDKNGFLQDDLRGKHNSHNCVDTQLLQDIRDHINSIPRIESHYVRANTTKEFIDGGKTITELFRDFQKLQTEKKKPFGKYCTFYNIFNTEFNLGFHQPKKDQCDLCLMYENATSEEKMRINGIYNSHHDEKELSRKDKRADRSNIDKNRKVVVYDMQAVLQCPRGETSAFYYKSKLNNYNFTLTELSKKKSDTKNKGYDRVHCYFWNETDAKRGANEIGSCIFEYLQQISESNDDALDVVFYSDNCCGQNKNKFITTLYLYAVANLNINSITHKFLVKGHTQNEGDNIHSLIKKEIKRNLRSGPIYSPHQYTTLIKSAKKSPPPFLVHELTYESFFDLKHLQEQWGNNFTQDKTGRSINWNDIKIMKFKKENPLVFLFKTSYKEEQFVEVVVRHKKKKFTPIKDISLSKAYTGKQELGENKKSDLKELVSKQLIPSFYADFYNNIL